jgi:hypothetical protein
MLPGGAVHECAQLLFVVFLLFRHSVCFVTAIPTGAWTMYGRALVEYAWPVLEI